MNGDEDLGSDYSLSKWWRWVRTEMGDRKAGGFRNFLFSLSAIYLVFGVTRIVTNWESLCEWWKIISMT